MSCENLDTIHVLRDGRDIPMGVRVDTKRLGIDPILTATSLRELGDGVTISDETRVTHYTRGSQEAATLAIRAADIISSVYQPEE